MCGCGVVEGLQRPSWHDCTQGLAFFLPLPPDVLCSSVGTCGILAGLGRTEGEIRGHWPCGGVGWGGHVLGQLVLEVGVQLGWLAPHRERHGWGVQPASHTPARDLACPQVGARASLPCRSVVQPCRRTVGRWGCSQAGWVRAIRWPLAPPMAWDSCHMSAAGGAMPRSPAAAGAIRRASGPTAAPWDCTTMLGAVCLAVLLGYGECGRRGWGKWDPGIRRGPGPRGAGGC